MALSNALIDLVRLDPKHARKDPSEILKITTLSIANHAIRSLPDDIDKLIFLKQLYLCRTNLTVLPDSIGSLSSLEVLWITVNGLTALPDSIGNLSSLRDLCLVYNKLISFPGFTGNLSSLENLRFDADVELPGSMRYLTSLDPSAIDDNELKAAAQGARCRRCGCMPFRIRFRMDVCYECFSLEVGLLYMGHADGGSPLNSFPIELIRVIASLL